MDDHAEIGSKSEMIKSYFLAGKSRISRAKLAKLKLSNVFPKFIPPFFDAKNVSPFF
jgi:hypothetical protein